jgi:hypothetical protein
VEQHAKLDKWIKNWADEIDANKKCPYAKPTVNSNKLKTVMLDSINVYEFWATIHKEADKFDDAHDVVIVAMEADENVMNIQQLQGGCYSINAGHNSRNTDLWCLNLHNQFYFMVLLQRLSALDDASRAFEKKDYYDDHEAFAIKDILNRRALRENLS